MAVINLFCYFLHQVINFTPTNSYLDDCLFNQMVAHAQKHPNKPRNAEGWILKGSNYHKPTCVSATFDSLVKLGLLRKERRNLGTCVKYPTVNPGTVTCIIALILFPNVRETKYLSLGFWIPHRGLQIPIINGHFRITLWAEFLGFRFPQAKICWSPDSTTHVQ